MNKELADLITRITRATDDFYHSLDENSRMLLVEGMAIVLAIHFNGEISITEESDGEDYCDILDSIFEGYEEVELGRATERETEQASE